MQRGNELARRRRRILRFMPAPNVWQYELHARYGLRYGQVARVTDAAAIGVGGPVVVMDLLGDGGGSLKTRKKG